MITHRILNIFLRLTSWFIILKNRIREGSITINLTEIVHEDMKWTDQVAKPLTRSNSFNFKYEIAMPTRIRASEQAVH